MGNEEYLYDLVRTGEWEIDAKGNVWGRRGNQRVRIEHRTPQGYLQIRKMRNGVRLYTGAHRLVWRHFNGPIPPGITINHKNGVKDDNRLGNLELATYSENMIHAFRTGLKTQWGDKNPAAKLSNEDVAQIREVYAQGHVTQATLAEQYGVCFQTISDIVRGTRRACQKGPISDYTEWRQRRKMKRNAKGQFIS